jgi:PqqD family protein of HPr-rel-A system
MNELMTRPAPHSEVSAYPLDDDLVVYDGRNGQAFVLNQTAARIWGLVDGSRTLDAMANELVASYGIEYERALADVQEFLKSVEERGLLARRRKSGCGCRDDD